ncbi:MAG: hypothetical protein J6B55_07110 [Clostridia bacterium]|nr:hypothetical protein [Clostridia bacterium]
MKNLFKKLLPALIIALVLTVALAVTAFATDDWVGTVTLLDMSQDGVEASGYSDIDGNSAWTQVASPTVKSTYAFNDANFYWGWNYFAYYNSTTKTIVFMPNTQNTMSARNNTAGIHVGEGTITDVTGIDERFWGEKWAGGQKAYYAHSFETWLDAYGAQVENVEFRPYKGNAGTTPVIAQEFGAYVADDLTNIKTVKMTSDFSFRSADNTADKYNQIFLNKASLTTVQQGTFAANGDFSATTPANAVTLVEGPNTATKMGVSGVIFRGCTSITRVIIESNTVNYVGLRNNMFNGCTSLKFVYIGVPMSDSYLVGTNAFNNCSDVNVYVDSTAAATALAAVTNITLKAHTEYDADIKEYFSKNAPIYADGVLVKIADTDTAAGKNVAVRFLFRWDAANTPAAGTPVKVGVVACTADYYAALGSGGEAEKLAALLADTNTQKVKKNDIAVYENGEMSLKGKFLKEGTDTASGIYCYAYTLYGIPAANYDGEIYAATYIQWADGTYSVVSNSYTDSTGTEKNTISLYDVTLGLFKQGLINSEKVADKYLWDVIEGMKAHSHSMTSTSAGGSNVDYLFFPDNIDGGYVLAYRPTEKYAEDGVTLKGASIPHNGNYWGSPSKLAASTTYYYQTHTIVVDYGVTGVGGARIFGGPYSTTTYNETVKTIVYPNGFSLDSGKSTEATHAFHMLAYIQDVIWCHTDSDGNYVKHMSDITWSANCVQKNQLIDLRGFGTTVDSSTTGNFTWDMTAAYYPAEKMNIIVSSDCTIAAAVGNRKIIWKAS